MKHYWFVLGLKQKKRPSHYKPAQGSIKMQKFSLCERYWDRISLLSLVKKTCVTTEAFDSGSVHFVVGGADEGWGNVIDSCSCAATTGCKTRLKEQQARKVNYLMVVVSHICSKTLSACLFC